MVSYTKVLPLNRCEWDLDLEGILTTVKDADSVKSYTFDYTNELDSGETISTSSWSCEGVTNDADTNTTTTTTITISDSGGYAKNTVVTSASRTLIHRFRFRDSNK